MFASTLYIAGAEDVGIGGETKKKVREPPETTISEDPIPEPPLFFLAVLGKLKEERNCSSIT